MAIDERVMVCSTRNVDDNGCDGQNWWEAMGEELT